MNKPKRRNASTNCTCWKSKRQVNSIVRVRNSNGSGGERRRAKLVKTAGVPGLSRVLVCYEGLDYSKNVKDATSVKKGDLVLIDRIELEKDPFQGGNASASANANAKPPKTNSDNQLVAPGLALAVQQVQGEEEVTVGGGRRKTYEYQSPHQ